MIKKLAESSGNVVGYKAIGTITAADYLKFGSEFHNNIHKLALVGDMTWAQWITHLATPFSAHHAKFFHSADIGKAWAWLRE